MKDRESGANSMHLTMESRCGHGSHGVPARGGRPRHSSVIKECMWVSGFEHADRPSYYFLSTYYALLPASTAYNGFRPWAPQALHSHVCSSHFLTPVTPLTPPMLALSLASLNERAFACPPVRTHAPSSGRMPLSVQPSPGQGCGVVGEGA